MAVALEVVAGDVLTYPADLVAFKHADEFYGADSKAARKLRSVGYTDGDLAAVRGQHKIVQTRGALAAKAAIFIGVGALVNVGYDDIRSFGRRAVELAMEIRGVRHLALTPHGRGIGLDEREAFLSQVTGCLEALEHETPAGGLERITVVELLPELARFLGEALRDQLTEFEYRGVHQGEGVWRFEINDTARRVTHPGPPGSHEAKSIQLLTRNPDAEPHIFIAYPFELEDHARFGIERPAHEAGFLARLIGDQVYTGEILARIKRQIESAALVVALLTRANPNVYLEVGYAWGREKPTLLVAEEGEELRFDVAGYRAVKYVNITDLERKFKAELAELARIGWI